MSEEQENLSTVELGEMIAELDELRDRKRALNEELKAIDEQYRELEYKILDELDRTGVEMTRTSRATVSISKQIYPTVVDWDKAFEYIRQNDAMYLFQRRLAAGPCKEMWESGEEIPGVEQYEKRGINLRKNR